MKRVTYLLILGLLFLGADPGIKSSQESAVKPTATSQSSLAFGLLVDNSGSVRQHFSDVVGVSKGIVENSQSRDAIFLVRFVNVEVIQIVRDFTSQKAT
jgi:hypothetical protein